MPDRAIRCVNCQQEFVWTEGEQEFYQSKKLPSPTLCLICRAKAKAQREDRAQYTKNEI